MAELPSWNLKWFLGCDNKPGDFYPLGWALVVVGVLLVALAACGGGESPAPTLPAKGDAAKESAVTQSSAPPAETPAADDQAKSETSFSQSSGESSECKEDKSALVALYNATDGPNWTDNENWLTDADIGNWAGVSASVNVNLDGTVTECVITLHLSENQLNGEIPAELGKLSEMFGLSLDGNQLTGEIPPELGKIIYLERLDLAENQLTGEIPSELGDLRDLASLDLSDNHLTGEIPSELGKLGNLEWVRLEGNALTGCVPKSLLDANGDADRLDLPPCS